MEGILLASIGKLHKLHGAQKSAEEITVTKHLQIYELFLYLLSKTYSLVKAGLWKQVWGIKSWFDFQI